MKIKLTIVVLLCILLSFLSHLAASQASTDSECNIRADKCSINLAMEFQKNLEHKILGNKGPYQWYYRQIENPPVPEEGSDPNLCLASTTCH